MSHAEPTQDLRVAGPRMTTPEPVNAAGTDERPDPPRATGPIGAPERPTKSLSPSRAGDFMTCPLLYRFRVIDQLPEPPGAEAVRGTLVHAVLERLFDLEPDQRTPQRAEALLPEQWRSLLSDEGEQLAALVLGPESNWQAHLDAEPLVPPTEEAVARFLAEAAERLAVYFEMEDPRVLEPAEREMFVSAELPGGLVLRGYVDRLDRAPDGRTRVVDYKTGRAPADAFAQKAMFQMKCYALALWRSSGTMPTLLQLMYLGNGEYLRYEPDERDLLATERKLAALWQAIERATRLGDWRANPSRLCDWCAHKALCPAWGGTPPPLPSEQNAPDDSSTDRPAGPVLP